MLAALATGKVEIELCHELEARLKNKVRFSKHRKKNSKETKESIERTSN